MTRLSTLSAGLTFLALVGCGYQGDNSAIAVYPTTGKISLANGQPARGAVVLFIPKGTAGVNGSGVLDSEGKFTMKSLEREGMPPGKYKVVLNPNTANPAISAADRAFGKSNIQKKFWSDETTTVEADVEAKPNTLDLVLK